MFGTAVGDALGVPVEFNSRGALNVNPVKDMAGFGTHNQLAGTWSDDSSLSFCLAESLCHGYNIKNIANKFIQWYDGGLWTPHGEVFDIGHTTRNAILNLINGVEPVLAGEDGERSNGNGSLMRILPLFTYINGLETDEKYRIIIEVSSITHRHPRSVLGCIIFLEYACSLLHSNPEKSLLSASNSISNNLSRYPELLKEAHHFSRLLEIKNFSPLLTSLTVDQIRSSGYVVDTLEASIWCLITTNSFEEAVLRAVNLGGDTDTTGAVTGALAAIYYGYEAIPHTWVDQLARKDDIEALADKLQNYYDESAINF